MRTQLFTFYVFFEGHGTGELGEVDLTYDLRVTRPNGLWVACGKGAFTATSPFQAADGFLLELVELDPRLFPELFDGLKKRSATEKRGVLRLLAHSSVEAAPFVRSSPRKTRPSGASPRAPFARTRCASSTTSTSCGAATWPRAVWRRCNA